MYSKETLAKVISELKNGIEFYSKAIKNGIKPDVSISEGNRKIGRVLNVSLAPIITCANCSGCMNLCYDIKACLQYKNVRDARAKNTALVTLDMEEFFKQIDEKISRRRKNKYFRWHVSGDILNMKYFENMVNIARKHPDFIFWTYTKNYGIVNLYCYKYGKESIPENLHIMFSEWRGMPMVNPFGFPEFRVVFKDDEVKPDPSENFYCPGNCDSCKAINRGCLAGETTYCNEH